MRLPLPTDYARCLAHTAHKNEWCPRRDTCARHLTIRHDKLDGSLHVKERLCVSSEFEQFAPVEPD